MGSGHIPEVPKFMPPFILSSLIPSSPIMWAGTFNPSFPIMWASTFNPSSPIMWASTCKRRSNLELQGIAGGLVYSHLPPPPLTSLPHYAHLVHNDVMFLDPLFSTFRKVFRENVHNTMQELNHNQRRDWGEGEGKWRR